MVFPAESVDEACRILYAYPMEGYPNEQSVCALVRAALADGLGRSLNRAVSPEQIRLPARGADAGCAAALGYGLDAASLATELQAARERFPTVLGALLVKSVRAVRGWLLFDLHGDFYAALADACAVPAEEIPSDHEIYPLHRLRMLARYPSRGCPEDPDVQRMLLLALAANESPTAANCARAENAVLTLAHRLPPAERSALLIRCGSAARAAAALLYGCKAANRYEP